MTTKDGGKRHSERIQALTRREKPDRVPVWPFFDMTGFSAVYHNRPIIDAYVDQRASLEMQRKTCEDFGWVCSPFFPSFGVIDFGGEVKLPKSEFSQAPSTTRFPIEHEEDVDKLEIPEISTTTGILREEAFNKLVEKNPSDIEPFRMLLMLVPSDRALHIRGRRSRGGS